MMRRWKTRLKATVRRILRAAGTPEEIARGVAAGFAVAPWPLPGLQVPLSLLLATLVRGNRVVSVIPQAISNPVTMLPLALAQYRLGTWLLPCYRETVDVRRQIGEIKDAFDAFAWTDFMASARRFYGVLSGLGEDVGIPLFVGTLLCSVVGAAAGYFGTLAAVRAYRAGRAGRAGGGGRADQAAQTAAADRSSRPEGRSVEPSSEKTRPVGMDGSSCRAAASSRPEGVAAAEWSDVGRKEAAPAFSSEAWKADALRFGLRPERFLNGNRLKLLRDGREAYPVMLDAIEKAESSVFLEVYTIRDDFVGRRFAEALARKAREGLDVRLVYDAIGSAGLSEDFLGPMNRAGVKTVAFHPVAPWRRDWALNKRDHRKLLVADGARGFLGGINISREYAPSEEGGENWRDTHVEICGPVAGALRDMFAWTLRHATGETIPCASGGAAAFADGVAAKVIANHPFRNRHAIRAEYARVIRRAEKFVFIANAFFVPDRGIRRLLRKAVGRGVRVEVMVPERSDVPAADYAGRAVFSRLLRAGVRIFLWPDRVLHAKTAVVDGVWSTVGSYNMNHRSLFHDLEATLIVVDRRFGAEMVEMFEADRAKCRELHIEDWERRPVKQKVLERLCYLIRYWL